MMSSAVAFAEYLKCRVAHLEENTMRLQINSSTTEFQEWEVIKKVSETLRTSNGLEFKVHKLRHRYLRDLFARGKRFDLSYMTSDQRQCAAEMAIRHPVVSRRLEKFPQFPKNESVVFSGDQFFWVIDHWEDANPLTKTVGDSGLKKEILPHVVRDILLGIQTLHEHAIIRRELLPDKVLLRDSDQSVLLTELELSKLLDGSPTVSREWTSNPYLAPELFDAGDTSKTVDLYSWAQLTWYAATGRKPKLQPIAPDFRIRELPKAVQDVCAHCIEPRPTMRPESAADILPVIEKWSATPRRKRRNV